MTKDGVDVEIAMQWNDSYNEQIFCYTNNVHNKDGGTHLTGLRTALTTHHQQLRPERRTSSRTSRAPLSGEDVREGLVAIVSVKHPDPSFDSQTKAKLVSSEVKGIVESIVDERLGQLPRGEPASGQARSSTRR